MTMSYAPAVTSIHHAVATALQGWIASQMSDHVVLDRFPQASQLKNPRSISVILAGSPKTQWLDEYAISFTAPVDGAQFGTWVVRLGQCETLIQLDTWDPSHNLRDDTSERLRIILRSNKTQTLGPNFITSTGNPLWNYSQPILEAQLALQLASPFSQVIAGYLFDEPVESDTNNSSQAKEWRAMWHGTAAYDYILTIPGSYGIAQLSSIILKIAASPSPVVPYEPAEPIDYTIIGEGSITTSGETDTTGTIVVVAGTNQYRANGNVTYTLNPGRREGEWHSFNLIGGSLTINVTGNSLQRPDNGALVSTMTVTYPGTTLTFWWDSTDGLWLPE